MRIEHVEMRAVRLPLVRPFRTSAGTKDHLTHILVRVDAGGVIGWGECASPSDPYYGPETTETCWHILKDFLVPRVLRRSWDTVDEVEAAYRLVKGNHFAKAGLEMACWDALARSRGVSLASALGGTQTHIASGVSLGIEDDPGRLDEGVQQYVDQGYLRIKLKIAPGADVETVRRVRERHPRLPLQVDANSAYTLADVATLRELDRFDLLMIEQPLGYDDIVDHARLQAELRTPLCLDESVPSAEQGRKALDLGACRVINIKVSRLGGLGESKRLHDLCRSRGIAVWCGGMHEFGIGRAANLAIASLPGFTLPGDIAGSDKSYAEDLVDPPIRAEGGYVPVPGGPGLGVLPVRERLERQTIRRWEASA